MALNSIIFNNACFDFQVKGNYLQNLLFKMSPAQYNYVEEECSRSAIDNN